MRWQIGKRWAIVPEQDRVLQKLFCDMCAAMFLLTLVYNFLRPFKITLMTSVSEAGGEVIPFLKLWGIVPASVVATWVYTVLSRRWGMARIFCAYTLFFVSYFALFGWVLGPWSDVVQLSGVAQALRSVLPSGLRGLTVCVEFWHVSLFYICCELWVTCMLYILFWGLVNEYVPFSRSARWYPLLNLAGNCGSAVSGVVGSGAISASRALAEVSGRSSQHTLLALTTLLASTLGLGLIPLYLRIARTLADPDVRVRFGDERPPPRQNVDVRLLESIRILFTDRYVYLLLVLVLAYNFVFNLSDVVFSHKLKEYFASDVLEMSLFMSQLNLIKGGFAIVLGLVAHVMIQRMGWLASALMTPAVILATSLAFYPIVVVSSGASQGWLGLLDWDMAGWLSLGLWAGGLQNALARAFKYSVYDSVREMVYVPLTQAQKRQAKAVLDGIAARFGKALGSIFLIVIFELNGTLEAALALIAVVSLGVSVYWVIAIFQLSKLIEARLGPGGEASPSAFPQ